MKRNSIYISPTIEVYELAQASNMLRSSVDTFESVNSAVSINEQNGFDSNDGTFSIDDWD